MTPTTPLSNRGDVSRKVPGVLIRKKKLQKIKINKKTKNQEKLAGVPVKAGPSGSVQLWLWRLSRGWAHWIVEPMGGAAWCANQDSSALAIQPPTRLCCFSFPNLLPHTRARGWTQPAKRNQFMMKHFWAWWTSYAYYPVARGVIRWLRFQILTH